MKRLLFTIVSIVLMASSASALSWAEAREACGLKPGFNHQPADFDDVCGIVLESEGIIPWALYYDPNVEAVEICKMAGIIPAETDTTRAATSEDLHTILARVRNGQYAIPDTPVRIVSDLGYLQHRLDACRYILAIKQIPKCVIDAYDGVICAGDLDTSAYSKKLGFSVAGIYYLDDNHICVEAPEYIAHEMGHFWDKHLGHPYSHYRLYVEEADQLAEIKGDYCLTDRYEFYAEAFDEYVSDPELLKEICPKTYACIKSELTR